MSTAVNPVGLKRICVSCGGRFYDLNKRPIICPECKTEFTGEVKTKTRRGRTPAAETKIEVVKKDEGEIQVEDVEVEVVSLEDAEPANDLKDDDASVLLGEDTLDDIPDIAATDEDDLDHEDVLLDDDADDK